MSTRTTLLVREIGRLTFEFHPLVFSDHSLFVHVRNHVQEPAMGQLQPLKCSHRLYRRKLT